jgi:hypothetical protein
MDAVRAFLIAGFGLLAILIPAVALNYAPPGPARRREYGRIIFTWTLLVAGIYAVLTDWRHNAPFQIQDAFRIFATASGAVFVGLGLRDRRRERDR